MTPPRMTLARSQYLKSDAPDLAEFVSDYMALVEAGEPHPTAKEVATAYLDQCYDPAGGVAFDDAVASLAPQLDYYL